MSQETMESDLKKSGLVASDLNARPLESPERAAIVVPVTTQGYVIPYYKIDGKPIGHYRCKLFTDSHIPKYKQPKESGNYIYYPPTFMRVSKTKPFVIITEGEKKAALATKLGFPAIALGGVDSWRSRTLIIPESSELNKKGDSIVAKMPQGDEAFEDTASSFAFGFQDFIDYVINTDKTVLFIYDTDLDGIKPQVQRAMANLAFELRYRGIPFAKLRQLILPQTAQHQKVGLDDYLLEHGVPAFQQLVGANLKQRAAFPQHPNPRDYVNKRLKGRLSRKELQQVSMAILASMDGEGMRLRSPQESQTYYFDNRSHKLLKADFTRWRDMHDTTFGQFLYKRYGLAKADSMAMEWLASQFTGEDPIGNVTPFRVLARPSIRDDSVIYQLSDSQYVKVTADKLTIHSNGENGVLFEAEQVQPVDTDKLVQEFERQKANATDRPVKPYWMDVLQTVRLKDHDSQQKITALLYYMSPWLYRWRGMQLPVEQIIGESGSGKSTLMELRLHTINGQPRLRNAPTDLKDWHASIANTGGLHVTDNVQLVDRSLRQRLSDEICRIITEPDPHIEMRKLYTNADLARIPVTAVFAITAIAQPFQNADLIQRSIITELDKLSSVKTDTDAPIVVRYDSEWLNNQLDKYNGREGWIAHHLLTLQRFFQLVRDEWDNRYYAKHRLINFEQSMVLMAKVLGMEHEWIPDYLSRTVDKAIAESDWAFEGLKTYVMTVARYYDPTKITAQAVADWATGAEEFAKCEVLINQRKLQRYMSQHKTMLASIIGLVEYTSPDGKILYKMVQPANPLKKAS